LDSSLYAGNLAFVERLFEYLAFNPEFNPDKPYLSSPASIMQEIFAEVRKSSIAIGILPAKWPKLISPQFQTPFSIIKRSFPLFPMPFVILLREVPKNQKSCTTQCLTGALGISSPVREELTKKKYNLFLFFSALFSLFFSLLSSSFPKKTKNSLIFF